MSARSFAALRRRAAIEICHVAEDGHVIRIVAKLHFDRVGAHTPEQAQQYRDPPHVDEDAKVIVAALNAHWAGK